MLPHQGTPLYSNSFYKRKGACLKRRTSFVWIDRIIGSQLSPDPSFAGRVLGGCLLLGLLQDSGLATCGVGNLLSLFLLAFFIKHFKHIKKLKEFYREYPYPYHPANTTNIFTVSTLPNSYLLIHPTHPFICLIFGAIQSTLQGQGALP